MMQSLRQKQKKQKEKRNNTFSPDRFGGPVFIYINQSETVLYSEGVVAKVISGNNTVEYTYDRKRRPTYVHLNGAFVLSMTKSRGAVIFNSPAWIFYEIFKTEKRF